jgi:hypothetical protein
MQHMMEDMRNYTIVEMVKIIKEMQKRRFLTNGQIAKQMGVCYATFNKIMDHEALNIPISPATAHKVYKYMSKLVAKENQSCGKFTGFSQQQPE